MQNNIITLETNIRLFSVRVKALEIKIKNKTISESEKKGQVLTLHKTAEELKIQINENLCREKYLKSFNEDFSKIKNMYFDILRVDEIRRDI